MHKKALRPLLVITVLTGTIGAFIWYFGNHPEVVAALKRTPPSTLVILFALYAVFIGTLVWVQRATLALCDLKLGRKESSLLVMYSSVINFFGPLQSGPAFRAAYLKTRHNLNLKQYTLATLTYYGIYAMFSGIFLASFLIGWWIVGLCALAYTIIPVVLRLKRFKSLSKQHIHSLALATLSQVLVTSIIYFVEIQSLLPQAGYLQSLAYTGAANFALFVSITPGAIGFREAFLLFSQQLHNIGGSTIAAASVMDRSVYIVLLLVLAAIVFGLHANDHFKTKPAVKR